VTIALGTSVSRVYQHFVLGAIGGLTGWYMAQLLTLAWAAAPISGGDVPLPQLAAQGALLGALIGLGASAFDGIATRSMARVIRFGGGSALAGMLAGATALPVLQALYGGTAGTPGAIAAAMLCWLLFGACIGLAEGFAHGAQKWKTVVGGLAGGLLGGALFEALGRPYQATPAILAAAMLTLGGCIAASVALVARLLTDAVIVIEAGKLKGDEVDVSKYVHRTLGARKPGLIGSSQFDANVYLPGDSGVLPRHATISYRDGAPTLTALPDAIQAKAVTAVNGRPVTVWPLSHGDRITIGSTTLLFTHRRQRRGEAAA
jgi:hypothetical protein